MKIFIYFCILKLKFGNQNINLDNKNIDQNAVFNVINMAKSKKQNTGKSKKTTTATEKKSIAEVMGVSYLVGNEKLNFVLGFIILAIAVLMILAFISYFTSGANDQSLLLDLRPNELLSRSKEFGNICGSIGALISYLLIARCFGIASFFIPVFIAFVGLQMMGAYKVNLWKWFFGTMVTMVWLSVTLALTLTPLMGNEVFYPGGDHGEVCRQFLEGVVGTPGLIAILVIVAIAFLTFVSAETITWIRKMLNPVNAIMSKIKFSVNYGNEEGADDAPTVEYGMVPDDTQYSDSAAQTAQFADGIATFNEPENSEDTSSVTLVDEVTGKTISNPPVNEPEMEVIVGKEEFAARGNRVDHYDMNTPINPREPFLNYQFPSLDLLAKFENDNKPFIDKEELIDNKKRIVEVLNSFGVQIREIKATVGPTITLYEITPAEGVRISRIRGLEDDIALSLAALGIRIIAPIPGKGTIGIEVPNAHASIVSMESILNSRKFQETTMELPIALGKTITNEVFMIDLAKQPHLLVAGATGQGKSVGLNAIITSLLYKKHPNELKIVLVDPKKVEFSVYGPIADHFMARVPDENEDPIITDVTKVVRTLKSLCALMDNRYDLLKLAGARNIKEYNKKFLSHQLNPEKGHEFMPYIVVIIDEFGDLIMTAGKEVELPIARIAQLARAVGIHMVIATQRPTTTIITGNIKANFPGRIAFKVSASVDSKTILDRTGANQLIGRGDLLFLNGAEPVRVQCAFVDTPEVEKIAKYIADQPGPLEPLELPEPITEGDTPGGIGDAGLADLDPLFEEAARYIVASNQGSTSSIQRKFSIGYNRAGRLMDQIERAGIVGAAQGSKPREVLITDENTLNALFMQLRS